MYFGNKTLSRMFKEQCNLDYEGENSDQNIWGFTQNREKLFKAKRINMQFDFVDQQMYYMRQLAIQLYYYFVGIIIVQFVILLWRNVGLLPVWTMIEYMQLVAFIPLYNFRMIPYLYDAFKPFLVAHLVLTNETFVFQDMQDDFFNINYDYYWLNVAKLGQSLVLICFGAIVLVFSNFVVFVLYKCSNKESRIGIWLGSILSQYKFNAYIRYYMLAYFDITFFSIMKIV
jgi:hypothetical protein